VRVPPPKLSKAIARRIRACLSELPDAPSAVRTEMASIASTLSFLSAELEYSEQHAKTCAASAAQLEARLGSLGLHLPADTLAILAHISSSSFPADKGDRVRDWLAEYLYACNQSELGMYRQGLAKRGDKA